MSFDFNVFEKEAHVLLKRAGFLVKERRKLIKETKPERYNERLEEWLILAEQNKKKPMPLESEEQKKVVAWFRKNYPNQKIVMIRNDGTRTAKEKTEQIELGLCPGAADLFIPHLNLWLEMKRVKNSKQSEKQIEFEKWAKSIGHHYAVGYGHADAIEKIVRTSLLHK